MTPIQFYSKKKNTKILKRNTENGFTMIELIVAIVIIGILSAMALLIFSNQQKAAARATVQNDVRSSVTALIKENQLLKLSTESQFLSRATISDKNVIGVKIDNSGSTPVACIWGLRKFSDTEIYVYNYSTATSKFVTGPCTGDIAANLVTQGSASSSPSNPLNPSTPSTPATPAGTVTGSGGQIILDDTNFKPYTDGVVTYTPRVQYNSYGSNSATIFVDITTTSTAVVAWQWRTDLNKAPYWGATSAEISYSDTLGVISYAGNILKINNATTYNGVSSTQPRTITYNLTKFTPPDILELYKVDITPSSGNTNWWACVEVRVTSDSVAPITWSSTVDLKKYFKSISGKTPSFTNLTNSSLGNSVYKISGNGTNSDTVTNTHPIYNSQKICYNPNNSAW